MTLSPLIGLLCNWTRVCRYYIAVVKPFLQADDRNKQSVNGWRIEYTAGISRLAIRPVARLIVAIQATLCSCLLLAGRAAAQNPSSASAHHPVHSGIRFEEIAAQSGLRFTTNNSPTAYKNQIETMVAGVALFDYDGDGWLDIYLVNGAAIYPSIFASMAVSGRPS